MNFTKLKNRFIIIFEKTQKFRWQKEDFKEEFLKKKKIN